jgi:septum formation protein
VVLASQSPRRRSLLLEILPQFNIVASEATELHDATLGPRRLCEVNAQRKAFAVAPLHPDHLVLGADTLVFLEGEPLGKPPDLAAAHAMLRRLSGRVHEVVTGVCLVHWGARRVRMFSDSTRVQFRALTDADIAEYLRRVPVLDKAGSYALQEEGHLIVDAVEGSHSNVVGLPVEAVRRALERWNEEGVPIVWTEGDSVDP